MKAQFCQASGNYYRRRDARRPEAEQNSRPTKKEPDRGVLEHEIINAAAAVPVRKHVDGRFQSRYERG